MNVRIYGTQVIGKQGIYPANEIISVSEGEAKILVESSLAEHTEAAPTFTPNTEGIKEVTAEQLESETVNEDFNEDEVEEESLLGKLTGQIFKKEEVKDE